jgi:CRP-like cAMP-binding protein
MSLEDDIVFLEQVPTLALLGRPALRILAIGAETRKISSGAVLYYAGDLADGAYVVQHGSFLLEPDRPGISEEVVAEPGTLLDELALVTDTVHTATATAQESSVVIRIPRTLFMKMLEGYPQAARILRDTMAERVAEWGRDIMTVKAKLEAALKKNPAN